MASAERDGLVLAAKVRLAIILLMLAMQAATTDAYGAAYAYAAGMTLVLGRPSLPRIGGQPPRGQVGDRSSTRCSRVDVAFLDRLGCREPVRRDPDDAARTVSSRAVLLVLHLSPAGRVLALVAAGLVDRGSDRPRPRRAILLGLYVAGNRDPSGARRAAVADADGRCDARDLHGACATARRHRRNPGPGRRPCRSHATVPQLGRARQCGRAGAGQSIPLLHRTSSTR